VDVVDDEVLALLPGVPDVNGSPHPSGVATAYKKRIP
jgi:hypothetical protein